MAKPPRWPFEGAGPAPHEKESIEGSQDQLEELIGRPLELAFRYQPEKRGEARKQFLREIKRLNPEVLASLAREVLPLFKPYCPPPIQDGEQLDGEQLYFVDDKFGYLHDNETEDHLVDLRSGLLYNQTSTVDFPLRDKLREWMERYNLNSSDEQQNWCGEYAFQTLFRWNYSGVPEELDWDYDLNGARADTVIDPPFTLQYVAWNPKAEPWPDYRDKVLERVEILLKDYRRRIESQIPKKERATNKRSPHHYTWLVEYQVNLLEINAIIEKYWYDWEQEGHAHLDYKTVRDGITSTAVLIGLSLRPSADSSKAETE